MKLNSRNISNISIIPFCDSDPRNSVDFVGNESLNVFGLFLQTQEVWGLSMNWNLNLELFASYFKSNKL